jgi:hypothetical protein
MLPVVVFPFLDMLNLDVPGEAFGHKLNLVPEAFHQHAGVPLDLFLPFVRLSTQLLELPVNRLESAIEVLNEFRVHRDSVIEKSMLNYFPCQ